jgi:hypothetical protein
MVIFVHLKDANHLTQKRLSETVTAVFWAEAFSNDSQIQGEGSLPVAIGALVAEPRVCFLL